MNTDFNFVLMLVIHFMADFGLQTEYQAQNKGLGDSFFNKPLLYHVGVYSLIWFIVTIGIKDILNWNFYQCLLFTFITFTSHYTTDWLTSRIGKPFWMKQDYHNGFNVVGFDQMLHYLQLWYTFKFVS